MQVKICGITNLRDAEICISCGANALGFILYQGSKRFIDYYKAMEIVRELPALTMKIGVFVNEDIKTINKVSKDIGLNAVQLHGDEKPGIVSQINLPVIKSFRINPEFDFNLVNEFKNCSYLFDTFDKSQYGGTGKTIDWSGIPAELISRNILAGGISVLNIEKIFNELKPAAIDLSSSLEKYPGRKDHLKIIEFFAKLNKLKENYADNNGTGLPGK